MREKIKMQILPVPENEKERLDILKSYEILDSLPEEESDALTRPENCTSYISS